MASAKFQNTFNVVKGLSLFMLNRRTTFRPAGGVNETIANLCLTYLSFQCIISLQITAAFPIGGARNGRVWIGNGNARKGVPGYGLVCLVPKCSVVSNRHFTPRLFESRSKLFLSMERMFIINRTKNTYIFSLQLLCKQFRPECASISAPAHITGCTARGPDAPIPRAASLGRSTEGREIGFCYSVQKVIGRPNDHPNFESNQNTDSGI